MFAVCVLVMDVGLSVRFWIGDKSKSDQPVNILLYTPAHLNHHIALAFNKRAKASPDSGPGKRPDRSLIANLIAGKPWDV